MYSLCRSALHSEGRESTARAAWLTRAARTLFLALLSSFLAGSVAVGAGDVAVVVHPEVQADDLSFAELRRIMLGDRQFWSPGKRAIVLVPGPVAPERTLLLEKIYGMTEAQYRQYWMAKLFRAEATTEPKAVLSNLEAVELVVVIRGAIALVDAQDVPQGLKVLTIGGAQPGDEAYPLR